MDLEKKRKGLCQTCKHAHNCGYISDKMTLFCEEFEVEQPQEIIGHDFFELKRAKIDTSIKYFEVEIGICSNCDNRANCNYSNRYRPATRCEEYK